MGQDSAEWVNKLKNDTIQDAKNKVTFAKQRQEGSGFVDRLESKVTDTGQKYFNKFSDWLIPPPVYKDEATKTPAPKQSAIKVSNQDASKQVGAAKQVAKQDGTRKQVMPKRVR